MLSLVLSTAITALSLGMLWHAYAHACRGYIERRQPDGIIGTSRA
jgi:hypothetical protein